MECQHGPTSAIRITYSCVRRAVATIDDCGANWIQGGGRHTHLAPGRQNGCAFFPGACQYIPLGFAERSTHPTTQDLPGTLCGTTLRCRAGCPRKKQPSNRRQHPSSAACAASILDWKLPENPSQTLVACFQPKPENIFLFFFLEFARLREGHGSWVESKPPPWFPSKNRQILKSSLARSRSTMSARVGPPVSLGDVERNFSQPFNSLRHMCQPSHNSTHAQEHASALKRCAQKRERQEMFTRLSVGVSLRLRSATSQSHQPLNSKIDRRGS